MDKVPADIAPSEIDLCPLHPARAQAVDEATLAANEATTAEVTPPRAIPVREDEQDEDIPLKAIPVE
jgi:hypothetical protein